MKFSLCFFAVVVLLGGVASDVRCIIQQLTFITPDRFFSHPFSVCPNIKETFEGVRRDIKTCTSHKINVDALETLHEEFCHPRSEFRKYFDRNKDCLAANMPNVRSCLENMSFTVRSGVLHGTVKQMCTKLADDTVYCLNEKVGRPCSGRPGGREVYRRITEASKPFFTGICLDAAGVEAEDDVVEVTSIPYVNVTDELFTRTTYKAEYSIKAFEDVEAAVAEALDVDVGYTIDKAVEAAVTEAVGAGVRSTTGKIDDSAVTEAVDAGVKSTTGKIDDSAVAKIVAVENSAAATSSAILVSLLVGVLIVLKLHG